MSECSHDIVSSTFERGPYCCQCNRPLVGFFTPIPRDTPAGALLYAMKVSGQAKATKEPKP